MNADEAKILTKQVGVTNEHVIKEIDLLIVEACRKGQGLIEVGGMFENLVVSNKMRVLSHFRERGFLTTKQNSLDGFGWLISWE